MKLTKKKDVGRLCYIFFQEEITEGQEEIVTKILYPEHKRVCINCMTRYGKTWTVAMGILLLIYFNENKKIALVGPTDVQALILRNYLIEMVFKSDLIMEIIQLDAKGADRLKQEASRKRQTFKNGCEYRVFSADKEANRLMGFGADVVVPDEAGLIKGEAWAKIMRMLGDDPQNAKMIELANPWNRDSKYYDHWTNPRYENIHVGWRQALKEGRVTQAFVDEMREELTPLQFQVLYESEFPDQAEDSIFNYKWIKEAMNRTKFKMGKGYMRIIACDPADKGLDWTVIMYLEEKNGRYNLIDIWAEPTSENMRIAGKVMQMIHKRKNQIDCVNLDCIGIGVGVTSRLRELLENTEIEINACHFGEKSRKDRKFKSDTIKKQFSNNKAEYYFRLKDLFMHGMITLPKDNKYMPKLVKDLLGMTWGPNSRGQIKIIDPEKSPDFADALVYGTWPQRPGIIWA